MDMEVLKTLWKLFDSSIIDADKEALAKSMLLMLKKAREQGEITHRAETVEKDLQAYVDERLEIKYRKISLAIENSASEIFNRAGRMPHIDGMVISAGETIKGIIFSEQELEQAQTINIHDGKLY